MTTAPPNFHTNKPSPFLQLPAELRNRIYDLALDSARPINIRQWELPTYCRKIRKASTPFYALRDITVGVACDCRNHKHAKNPSPEPALLRVSRQIRAEALGIFYGGNVFSCGDEDGKIDGDALCQWVLRLRNQKASLVRTLRVGMPMLYYDRIDSPVSGEREILTVRHTYLSVDVQCVFPVVSCLRELIAGEGIEFRRDAIDIPLPELVWEPCDSRDEVWVLERRWSNDQVELVRRCEEWVVQGLGSEALSALRRREDSNRWRW